MGYGTRRTFILGGIGLPYAEPAAAKKRNRRKRDKGRTPPDHAAILAALAERMVFGVRDEGTPLEALEARLASGLGVDALCGTQAHLAERALQRLGITARRVGALREPYGGSARRRGVALLRHHEQYPGSRQ